MLRNDRIPIKHYNNEEHHNVLQMHQNKTIRNNDTLKEASVTHVGSTETVQHEDTGSWTHDTTVECSDDNHNSQFYRIQIKNLTHHNEKDKTIKRTS